MRERSSSFDSNWCYVAPPGASMPSGALTDVNHPISLKDFANSSVLKAPLSEDEKDPVLQPLIKKSTRLKQTFKQASRSYGSSNADLRNAGDYFDNVYKNRPDHASKALASQEIGTVSRDILSEAQSELSDGKYQKREFFGSFIMDCESVFKQLGGLLGENNALIEELECLERNNEEQRVSCVSALLHSQKNLNFLIDELCEEIKAILSWRLDPRR